MKPDVSPETIVERSAPLPERLAVAEVLRGFPDENGLFDRWRDTFNTAGDNLFLRRLNSLGLSEQDARARLQAPLPPEQLSRELLKLAEIQEAFLYQAQAGFRGLELPFVALWSPIASFAHDRVFRKTDLFSSEISCLRLSQSLLEELCRIAAEPLYALFDEQRARGSSFAQFVQSVVNSKGQPLFDRFPALARCVVTVLNRWIDSTCLFLERLEQDRQQILESFPQLNPDATIDSVLTGLSDHHDGGLEVMLLEFSDQQRILYKPKDMSLEAELPRVNDWLASEGFGLRLRFPLALDKGDYGWSEFINAEPCRSREDVYNFFERAGALLCLAHTLNGKDLLLENIVAAGCDPVPIDLETFFQPEVQRIDRIGSPPPQNPPDYLRRGSVIETGMLPAGRITGLEVLCDLSGLSGNKDSLPEIRQVFWEAVNSDNMKRSEQGYRGGQGSNRPSLNGVYQHPKDFGPALIDGFRRLYQFISTRKESFIRFLETLSKAKTRLIFRSTQMYGLLLKQSLQPVNLSNGVSRSLVFESIYRPALKGNYLSPSLKLILEREAACLEHLDIPRFYIRLDSDRLMVDGRDEIPYFLLEPPLETVRQRVLAMSPGVEAYHIENIRESLRRRPRITGKTQSRAEIEDLVDTVAQDLLNRAGNQPSNDLWPQPSFFLEALPEHERTGLYLGDFGTTVFLAAWDSLTNSGKAKRALDALFHRLKSQQCGAHTPLGICNGLGSYLYGSLLLARFTDETRWIELADQFGAQISNERLSSEPDPDLIYGLAGGIVALTRWYEVKGDIQILERAQHGLEILRSRFLAGTGWVRPNGEACLGFAHGSAGIAFAALEVARVSNKELPLETATMAFALDRNFYSTSEKNWPSTSQRPGNPLRAWCSGLPGIILSRLYGWSLTQQPLLEREMNDGWRNFPGFLGLDHWCCGNLGLVEILEHASEKLNREDLKVAAQSLLDQTVQRALRSAFFRFSSNLGDNFCFQPSLFRGSAGLGYTLLRLQHPGKLPCILAFEV